MEVAPAALDEPIANRFKLVSVLVANIENLAYGDVVPTPTLPVLLIYRVEVPAAALVPVKYATWP